MRAFFYAFSKVCPARLCDLFGKTGPFCLPLLTCLSPWGMDFVFLG